MRWWVLQVYGFEPHIVWAPTRGAARYRSWKAASETGRFVGRDGFWRFLVNVGQPREAKPHEIQTMGRVSA